MFLKVEGLKVLFLFFLTIEFFLFDRGLKIKIISPCDIYISFNRANPKWKVDISKWGRKVPRVSTNEHGYEAFRLNITLFDLFNANVTFHMSAVLFLVI